MTEAKKWADEEIEQLKKLYLVDKKSYKEIGEILGRKWNSVRSKVSDLGIQRKRVYQDEHICAVCGDTESSRYYRWNHEGELEGKMLCGKHYNEMLKMVKSLTLQCLSILNHKNGQKMKRKNWKNAMLKNCR